MLLVWQATAFHCQSVLCVSNRKMVPRMSVNAVGVFTTQRTANVLSMENYERRTNTYAIDVGIIPAAIIPI